MIEPALKSIRIAGFRSLKDVTLDLSRLNVLIGPNGAGKSNLLAALRMVLHMRTQSLRLFVAEQGGASALLHYGPSTTREIRLHLDFESQYSPVAYDATLQYRAGDSFIFASETAELLKLGELTPTKRSLGVGHDESRLLDFAGDPMESAVRGVQYAIKQLGYFHFHDTSATSPLRQNSRQADNDYLRSDGANLAAFLYRLKESDAEGTRQAWQIISGLVRRIAPFIKELTPDLVTPDKPEQSAVRLYWIDRRDHRFDVHDLSDGTLRAIALITALAQPSSCRPLFIAIDEPELGLHPAAISIVAALMRSASVGHKVLIATQSPALLDHFEPQDIVVVEQHDGETQFKRLAADDLAGWLEDYSLSELYDKNVLGGRP
jgi:predicted ATPase